MMKQVLSILLAAVLLLSVFTALPITAGAIDADAADSGAEGDVAPEAAEKDLADTGATIRKVEVTDVDIPKPNAMPSYGAAVPTGQGYKVNPTTNGTTLLNGVSWFNVSDNETLKFSDRFVLGKQYKAIVYLQTTSAEYAFASSGLTATLNTHSAAIEGRVNNTLCISYTFTCRNTTSVSSVSVTVTAPVAGQNPSYVSTVPSGKGYSVRDVDDDLYQDGVNWCMVSDDNYYSVSPSSTFVNGGQYMVTVLLKPTDEYCVFSNSVSGTVNGKTAAVKKSYTNPDYRYIEYTFTCQPDPSKVTLRGNYTSYLDDSDIVTFELMVGGEVKYSASTTGNTGEYLFANIARAAYILRISKKNHETLTSSVTVSDNTVKDVKICPLGDVDGNGKVQANDAMKAYQHAQGKADAQLTNYAFFCADVAPVGEPNNKVQAADAMVIYQQAQGKHSLF